MKFSAIGFTLGISISLCCAQSSMFDEKGLSKTSAAYHQYRLEETQPTYSLKKVKALIAKIKFKENKEGEGGLESLDPKVFKSLSNQAMFTYCMLHGEVSSQNCDGMPAVLNEEKKLFAFPPGPFGEEADWSDNQRAFLHAHRSTVLGFLRQTMGQKKRAGNNLKKAIIELDAVELIPDMASLYKQSHKDHDLLSVMSVLMKNRKFRRYTTSDVYRKLYYGETNYKSSIPLTPYVEHLILSDALAMAHLHRS